MLRNPKIIPLSADDQKSLGATRDAFKQRQMDSANAHKAHKQAIQKYLAAQKPPIILKPGQQAYLLADGKSLVVDLK